MQSVRDYIFFSPSIVEMIFERKSEKYVRRAEETRRKKKFLFVKSSFNVIFRADLSIIISF